MLYKLTQAEVRNICREKIESLEYWLRRLIEITLSKEYGNYLAHTDEHGNRLISGAIIKSLEKRVSENPDRYPRMADAMLLDEAISIVCNPNLYKHFRESLLEAFPAGAEQARNVMGRLVEPRNRLSHANSISVRDAERILCYSNDIIDSLKTYYRKSGMSQDYNVPLILKVTDSLGNVYHREKMRTQMGGVRAGPQVQELRPGDILSVEIEVDPSYSPDTYTINWSSTYKIVGATTNEKKIQVHLNNTHVGEQFNLQCRIKTDKEWHRLGTGTDDLLVMSYKVLPPV